MTKEKCDYCKNKVYARCDFIRQDNTRIEIKVCEEHLPIGIARQDILASLDNLQEKLVTLLTSMTKNKETKCCMGGCGNVNCEHCGINRTQPEEKYPQKEDKK